MQEELAVSVAPDRLTAFDPETAVMVPAPQDPVKLFGVPTTSPLGKVSVNATPVMGTVFVLLIVKLRVVVVLTGIRPAPNDLLIEGGTTTVTVAVAVEPVPPSVEVTAPVVLF